MYIYYYYRLFRVGWRSSRQQALQGLGSMRPRRCERRKFSTLFSSLWATDIFSTVFFVRRRQRFKAHGNAHAEINYVHIVIQISVFKVTLNQNIDFQILKVVCSISDFDPSHFFCWRGIFITEHFIFKHDYRICFLKWESQKCIFSFEKHALRHGGNNVYLSESEVQSPRRSRIKEREREKKFITMKINAAHTSRLRAAPCTPCLPCDGYPGLLQEAHRLPGHARDAGARRTAHPKRSLRGAELSASPLPPLSMLRHSTSLLPG